MYTLEVDTNTKDVKSRLEGLTHDNIDPVYRPAGKRVQQSLVPFAKKLFNQQGQTLPPHLYELEKSYLKKVDWQRSRYIYQVLLDDVSTHEDSLSRVDRPIDRETAIEAGVPLDKIGATDHKFTTEGSIMSKSAGLPKFGSKREQLSYALQYVEWWKTDPIIARLYPAFLGYRTQQSSVEEPKVRNINMLPITTWVLEKEGLRDSVEKMKVHWTTTPGQAVDYMPPEKSYEFHVEMVSQSQSCVVLDATMYNKHVHESEIEMYAGEMLNDYEFKEQIIEYYKHAEILTPNGYVQRNGNILDGIVATNAIGSLSNVTDLFESFGPLQKYWAGYHVRGDDIRVYFDTAIREDNISAMGKQSRRPINTDKSDIRQDTAWFAKLYLDPGLPGWTKPIFLVLNSLTYKERESDAITSSRYYASIAATSILNSLEHHPIGEPIRNEYWRNVDKYPITSLDDEGLTDAMEAYLFRNQWQVEHNILDSDPDRSLNTLRSSWAAET